LFTGLVALIDGYTLWFEMFSGFAVVSFQIKQGLEP